MQGVVTTVGEDDPAAGIEVGFERVSMVMPFEEVYGLGCGTRQLEQRTLRLALTVQCY